MAKAPVAGYCKTRLIPHIGAPSAAKLQRDLINHTINTAQKAKLGQVILWCTPDTQHMAFIKERIQKKVILKRQVGHDLGARMLHAIRRGLMHNKKVILIGTDCPVLTTDDLLYASKQLDIVDHVYQPAEDGGYVMVASRKYVPKLFRSIPWGEHRVMSLTRRRLQQSGSIFTESNLLWDVDEFTDFKRMKTEKILD